mgnify:CR=1 FL=1
MITRRHFGAAALAAIGYPLRAEPAPLRIISAGGALTEIVFRLDAQALLALCVGGRIEKTRHYVEHLGHLWEVDEFFGDNAGLVVAEIELGSEHEAFAKPGWVGVEATHAPRYYNLALASRPYSQWREDEQQACDLNQGH